MFFFYFGLQTSQFLRTQHFSLSTDQNYPLKRAATKTPLPYFKQATTEKNTE
jgi:hypothetical protein